MTEGPKPDIAGMLLTPDPRHPRSSLVEVASRLEQSKIPFRFRFKRMSWYPGLINTIALEMQRAVNQVNPDFGLTVTAQRVAVIGERLVNSLGTPLLTAGENHELNEDLVQRYTGRKALVFTSHLVSGRAEQGLITDLSKHEITVPVLASVIATTTPEVVKSFEDRGTRVISLVTASEIRAHPNFKIAFSENNLGRLERWEQTRGPI